MAKPKINRSVIGHMLKFFGFSQAPIRSIISILTLGIGIGVGYEEMVGIGTWHSLHPQIDKFNICFTPPSGCGSLIAQEIVKSKKSVYVQAYGLTSYAIIYQLKAAHNRGVVVKVILDGGNLSDNSSVIKELANTGIEVYIDKMSGIAHNKIMIIDNKKVITGSFNFTNAADHRNAENVLLIEDANAASIYLKNWVSRKKASTRSN